MSRTSKFSLVLALTFVSYAYHVEAQSFVRAEGTRFVYQGHAITFYGATFFPSPVGGSSAWHRSTFPAYIDHIMVRAQQAGQNILRPTDFWNKKDPNQNF